MKRVIFLLTLTLAAGSLFASSIDAESGVENEETATEFEMMNSRGWHHIGCVSQVNSASTCRRKAAQKGYSESRIQQDYMCPPKVLYSCYGRGGAGAEIVNSEDGSELFVAPSETGANSSCSYYVKPAACVSHKECKWVGSCVPR